MRGSGVAGEASVAEDAYDEILSKKGVSAIELRRRRFTRFAKWAGSAWFKSVHELTRLGRARIIGLIVRTSPDRWFMTT